MIQVQGYKEVSYSGLQKEMDYRFEASDFTEIEIAIAVKVKSTATIKNAFRKDAQIVSDEVMTNVMKVIGVDGFILWVNAKRFYYIKQ
jgi:hypothetical protein